MSHDPTRCYVCDAAAARIAVLEDAIRETLAELPMCDEYNGRCAAHGFQRWPCDTELTRRTLESALLPSGPSSAEGTPSA